MLPSFVISIVPPSPPVNRPLHIPEEVGIRLREEVSDLKMNTEIHIRILDPNKEEDRNRLFRTLLLARLEQCAAGKKEGTGDGSGENNRSGIPFSSEI